MEAAKRIIVALDVDTIDDVRAIVEKAGKSISTFKVGMRLFTKYGPSLVKELKDKGYGVFLDLKYHDIPNTVETACREAGELGVDMLTIHACGGSEMCRAAAKGASEGANKAGKKAPIVLAVTVLTSMNEEALKEVGVERPLSSQVLNLAQMAVNEGVGGIVCSALEVKELKQKINKKFVAVVPGIRLPEGDTNDQKRVASPDVAVKDGADYLVMGRPIYGAKDPVEAIKRTCSLIEGVTKN